MKPLLALLLLFACTSAAIADDAPFANVRCGRIGCVWGK